MSKHILVVLSNAAEGQDEQFNKWYTNTHLGDVIRIEGYVAAQRYKLSDTQLGGATGQPYGYLALYDVETDDLEAAAKALTSRDPADMYVDPALDRDRTVAWLYTPITEKVSRK